MNIKAPSANSLVVRTYTIDTDTDELLKQASLITCKSKSAIVREGIAAEHKRIMRNHKRKGGD